MMELGPIHEADDVSIAPRVDSKEALLGLGAGASRSYVMSPGAMRPRASVAKTLLQPAGENVPDWFASDQGVYVGEVCAIRLTDCYYLPKFGTLIDASGAVSKLSFEEARYVVGDVTNLPCVFAQGGEAFFHVPSDTKTIDDAVIFMPWGALHNYGHFILDALPSLILLNKLSTSRQWNILSPPLSVWQRDLFDLVARKLGNVSLTIVPADVVSLQSVLFFSTMDHFLHRGSPIWGDVRTALLADAPMLRQPGRRVIIVRYDAKREFTNQSEVVTALTELGFEAVAPEQLSIEQQRDLFSQAEIVVGVSGAGLANLIFCRPDTLVIEIQPSLGRGIWVRNVCVHLDLGWAPFFVESTPPTAMQIVGGQVRPEIGISFQVPVGPFVAHVRRVLETMASRLAE